MGKQDDYTEEEAERSSRKQRLAITFVSLLVCGLGNKVFIKLATIPLFNYPIFVTLASTAIYIPTSFAYIIPAQRAGRITETDRSVPQLVFFTMGALDSLAGIMQLFATTYIKSGSLLILLQQASIPLSMAISAVSLGARYSRAQCAGALIVIGGIAVILAPTFRPGSAESSGCTSALCSPILWSAVLVLSCVPMCMSTVFKERALAKIDIDPIYLNGWVAVWQFLFTIPVAFLAAPLSGVRPLDVPANLLNGAACFVGVDTVGWADATSSRPADHCWPGGLVYLAAYLLFNQMYNVLIVLMLKYGSSSLLYLAMTLLVPLGNCAFALPFMPGAAPLTLANFSGLVVIMAGLCVYRFFDTALRRCRERAPEPPPTPTMARSHARRASVLMASTSGILAVESLHTLIEAPLVASPLASRSLASLMSAPPKGSTSRRRSSIAMFESTLDLLKFDLRQEPAGPIGQSLSAALLPRDYAIPVALRTVKVTIGLRASCS